MQILFFFLPTEIGAWIDQMSPDFAKEQKIRIISQIKGPMMSSPHSIFVCS